MSWQISNKHLQLLRQAEDGGYGVIAAIAYNLEQIVGLVQAANKAKSPLILQFFPWALEFGDGILIKVASQAARSAKVPISIHLDHCQRPELVKKAADMGLFDSIMVDMSHYDKDENLRRTKELVAYCNDRQIATEAEPGRIEGGEDGVVDTEALEGMKTTPEEIDDFIATGVDALAPAFGNVHGEYGPDGPHLDFDRSEFVIELNITDKWSRLIDIRSRVAKRVCVVLHGTNGFQPALLQKCIAAGVTKVNVNRLVLDTYYDHLHANAGKMPHTQLLEEGVQKVSELTVQWMNHCGSAGRA